MEVITLEKLKERIAIFEELKSNLKIHSYEMSEDARELSSLFTALIDKLHEEMKELLQND
jgi:hypothetical protein